ncbi:hypothetical protein DXG01_001172 [Tephrocybe rancida]|nr:hypothetical protein DXG01_001172 [Tephrocybe rancida]
MGRRDTRPCKHLAVRTPCLENSYFVSLRTPAQMEKLLDRLLTCGSPTTSAYLQELHPSNARLPAHVYKHSTRGLEQDAGPLDRGSPTAFPIAGFLLLGDVLSESNIKPVALGQLKWPASPLHLFPLDPDASVEAVIQWQDTLQHTIVHYVCSHAMRLCRGLLVPGMVSHSFCGHHIEVGRRLFDLLQLQGWISIAEQILALEQDLRIALVQGHAVKLCEVSTLLLYAVTGPRFPEAEHPEALFDTPIAYLAPLLYRAFQLERHRVALHSKMLEHMFKQIQSMVAPAPSGSDSLAPWDELIVLGVSALRSARQGMRCAGLGCENTLQHCGKDLKRCARCGVTAYCGRRCQEQDWRNGMYPQEEMGIVLRRLPDKGGRRAAFRTESATNFERVWGNWEAGGVTVDEMGALVGWWEDRKNRKLEERPRGITHSVQEPPGFDDCDDVVWQSGASGRGPSLSQFLQLGGWKTPPVKYFHGR